MVPLGETCALQNRAGTLSVHASTYSTFLQGHFLRGFAICYGSELHRPYYWIFNDHVIEKELSRRRI